MRAPLRWGPAITASRPSHEIPTLKSWKVALFHRPTCFLSFLLDYCGYSDQSHQLSSADQQPRLRLFTRGSCPSPSISCQIVFHHPPIFSTRMEPRRSHQFDLFGPQGAAYDEPNPIVDNIDWNDPSSFFKAMEAGQPGRMPLPDIKSPAEVRKKAAARTEGIFSKHKILRLILERHEATIQKRWLRKTRQQRLKILLDAWPDIPANHRPDFEAFSKEAMKDRLQGTTKRGSFIWPYVNQQDLADTKSFLLLLNARGRHSPSHFAAADNRAIHLGLVSGAIVPIFLNEHVMILNGVNGDSHEYRRLVSLDEEPDAFDWMMSGKQFFPGEGLLILEAQERLLEFLIQCSSGLLHEIDKESMICDDFPVLDEPRLKNESEISGF
ncbi:unnamed protein product [Penicillium olsonii]|nr:unnamed protein product [Penicillium olsonii]